MKNTLGPLGLALFLALLAPGCGSSPSSVPYPSTLIPPIDPATAGTLTVHLVQDGDPGQVQAGLPGPLSHLNLAFTGLELRSGGIWRPVQLSAPQPVDILAWNSAKALVLASAVPWPEGSADAIRFTLGPGGSAQLGDTTNPLTGPAQFVALMGPPGSIVVNTGANTDLWITFAVNNVVFQDPANDSGFMFRPGQVLGYDKAETGSLHGTLTGLPLPGAENPTPLPIKGAPVTAQQVLPITSPPQPGAAMAFRTVLSDPADGTYTLDLLPKGFAYTWSAVSQPVLGTAVYEGCASPGFILGDPPYDTHRSDLAVQAIAVPGKVSGAVLAGAAAAPPVPGVTEVVGLLEPFTLGNVTCQFVMAEAPVGTDGSYSFPAVAPGIYSLVLNPYLLSPDLILVDDNAQASGEFVLSAGNTFTLSFQQPTLP